MENKLDILMYVSAIVGGVIGAYLCAANNPLGAIVIICCTGYILYRTGTLYTIAKRERDAEKTAEEERKREEKRLARIEKENKYNSIRNELISRNGEPGRTILINTLYEFNIENELIVFDKTKKLWLCGEEIAIENINSFVVDDESTIQKGQIKAVTSTDTGSLAGRSIAGALLGGEAGAIIGGATAKKETIFSQEDDKVIHNYALIVNIRDLNKPMITIKIGKDKNKALEINALMEVVMTMK